MANPLLFLLPPLLFTVAAGAQQATALAKDRARGAAAVTIDDCSRWLHTLASPGFGGRGTGQDGFRLAAEYVRDHFKALGLRPAGDEGSYFQRVPWGAGKVQLQQTSLVFAREGHEPLVIPGDRLAGTAARSDAAAGAVTLITTIDEQQLATADLQGRVVVLLLDGVDARAQFNAMRALQGKQAAAVLMAQQAEVQGGIQTRSGARGNPAARGMQNLPAMLSFGGKDLEALMALAGQGETATVRPLPVQATLRITVEQAEVPAFNVCAILPGSDPSVADEYVVIGSHLDHLGQRGNTVFPGADDDASGTTGVMAVAQMLARNPTPPRRSVLFLCFCGEENGLVGSRHYAQNPTVPLAAMVAELQMDMIGRNEEENVEGNKGEKAEDNENSLHLVGTQKLSRQLHEICMQKNETAGFDLEWDQEGMFGRSDHANFARMGVPIAFFFTGLHRDYHRPSDTPDKINYPKLLRVATYVYDIAFELAQAPSRPEVDADLWAAYRGKGSEQPAAPLKQD